MQTNKTLEKEDTDFAQITYSDTGIRESAGEFHKKFCAAEVEAQKFALKRMTLFDNRYQIRILCHKKQSFKNGGRVDISHCLRR